MMAIIKFLKIEQFENLNRISGSERRGKKMKKVVKKINYFLLYVCLRAHSLSKTRIKK